MKIKVGVVFGGETVEHEVSIITALQAMEHMDTEKYDIVPIYISKDRYWYTGKMLMDIDVYRDFEDLKRYATKCVLVHKKDGYYLQKTSGLFNKDITDIDIIFPIVHGNNVEDGTLQGYIDTIGIPYVGSRVLGSALGQDKVVMKQVFASMNLPIVDYCWFFDTEYLDDADGIVNKISKLGYPVVVKPATLGSSVGITYVESEKEIKKAIDEAIKYDVKIVIQHSQGTPDMMQDNPNYDSVVDDIYLDFAKNKLKILCGPSKRSISFSSVKSIYILLFFSLAKVCLESS